MGTGRQLIGSFGVLLTIQALTSFVAIGLLSRMSPAIERILEENVYSVQAVEEMLAVLSEPGPADDTASRIYAEALRRAEHNVTEEDERAPLDELERLKPAALRGDVPARRRSAEALRELGEVNREAMQAADEQAKQLGTAGAWAAALLGIVGLAASVLAMGRARRRLLAPMNELVRVVDAHRQGDTPRRCAPNPVAVPELARVTAELNRLYDAEETRPPEDYAAGTIERSLLLHLLDDREGPVAVVDDRGQLVATNTAADELLASDRGARVRRALLQAAEGESPPEVASRVQLGDTGAHMCSLSAIE